MNTLYGKTILITGATAGIGKALAWAASRESGQLILIGRRAHLLETLKAELAEKTVYTAVCDVSQPESIHQFWNQLPGHLRKIDVLVNNAGLALGLEPADQCSYSDWEKMVATNINGLLALTHHILPGMRARNQGHIVNLSSIAATYPYPGGNVYAATKAFVTQFSLGLRADLLGSAIRVTNIEPGMVETEFSEVRFHGDQARAAAVYQGLQPLTPEDIADTILWAITRPSHVNINRIELMPVLQSPGGALVHRTSN